MSTDPSLSEFVQWSAAHVQEFTRRQRDTCRYKRVFRSEDTAAAAAEGATEQYSQQMYYYECPVCTNYHLTRQAPPEESP